MYTTGCYASFEKQLTPVTCNNMGKPEDIMLSEISQYTERQLSHDQNSMNYPSKDS